MKTYSRKIIENSIKHYSRILNEGGNLDVKTLNVVLNDETIPNWIKLPKFLLKAWVLQEYENEILEKAGDGFRDVIYDNTCFSVYEIVDDKVQLAEWLNQAGFTPNELRLPKDWFSVLDWSDKLKTNPDNTLIAYIWDHTSMYLMPPECEKNIKTVMNWISHNGAQGIFNKYIFIMKSIDSIDAEYVYVKGVKHPIDENGVIG